LTYCLTVTIPVFLTFIGLVWRPGMKVLGDSKVTSKFQTTIPRAVRRLLDLNSGDRVVFVIQRGNVVLKKGNLEVEA